MRFKPSDALRFLGGLAAAIAVLGLIVLRVTSPAPNPAHIAAQVQPLGHVARQASTLRPPPIAAAPADCEAGPLAAARANAASLQTLTWAPFGRPEVGWETYAPLVAHEVGTACAPDTPGFAAALARWQARQRLAADGIMSEAVFNALRDILELRRPFVQVSAHGFCPAVAPDTALTWAAKAEGYSGKPIQLRPGALSAYRQMAAAARADPRIAADRRNLTIFSGFRGSGADDARCAGEGNCNGKVRATCSAHRTGLAMDLYVGEAPGLRPDSSANANRLYMSRSPTYRWLVANADRFGFVPYPFEPWHWEWTGEAPVASS